MEIVLAAVITGLFALLIEGLRRQGQLASKLETNHGKEPFEYLEMVAVVDGKVDKLVDLLAAHTVQDEMNFRQIDERLKRLA